MRFAGKGAFVTGAGHGIGRATTVRLADEGAAVLCFDLKPEGAEETALLIEGRGGRGAAARVTSATAGRSSRRSPSRGSAPAPSRTW